jgi:transposase InsO family protein
MRETVADLTVRGITARRACEALQVDRTSMSYKPLPEDVTSVWLRDKLRALSGRFIRYGTPRMTSLLRREKLVNHKRVERIWKEENLPIPRKRKRRLNVLPLTLRSFSAGRPGETWSMDFIHSKTEYGQKLKMLTVLDDFTRKCLEVRVEKSLRSPDVIEILDELMTEHGAPKYIRTDNGPEFIAGILRQWLQEKGVTLIHIAPGSPWENGYVESFHGKLRDECLNGEIFFSRGEAQVVIDWWTDHYNTERPHSALGYLSPVEFIDRNGYGNHGQPSVVHRSHSTTTTSGNRLWN